MRSRFVLGFAKILGGLAIVFAILIAFSFGMSLADGRSSDSLGDALVTIAILLLVGMPLYAFGSGNAQLLLRTSKAKRRTYGYVTSFWLVFIVLPAIATLLATQSPGIAFVVFAILALALTEQERGLGRPFWKFWARLWRLDG
jgi:ABC-type dipeptide/oligopeptide/nickel transport system permease component